MYGNKKSNKGGWVLLLLLMAGIVVGGFIGEYVAGLPYMGWLGYGQAFGFEDPVRLELGILTLRFAFMARINMAGILGMLISFFVYRRM